MLTSIGVAASTRNQLERVKRELAAQSFDATINQLMQEHAAKATHQDALRLSRLLGHRKDIAAFAQQNGIRSVKVFGSTLHGDAGPTSDIDLLVEFRPGHVPGLIKMATMELELGRLLGSKIDLQTLGSLGKYIRSSVEAEALEIYGEA